MEPTLTASLEETRVRTKTARPCTHSRVVDEVRSAKGDKTGRLICLECKGEFPDPAYKNPQR